jgi:DNA mismatch repair protein MSH5
MLGNQFALPYFLEIRPPAEFNTEIARNKLISLDLVVDDGPRIDFVTPGDMYGADFEDGEAVAQHKKLLGFAGYVDLENGASVRDC